MSPKNIHTLVSYARRHLFAEIQYYPEEAYRFLLVKEERFNERVANAKSNQGRDKN